MASARFSRSSKARRSLQGSSSVNPEPDSESTYELKPTAIRHRTRFALTQISTSPINLFGITNPGRTAERILPEALDTDLGRRVVRGTRR